MSQVGRPPSIATPVVYLLVSGGVATTYHFLPVSLWNLPLYFGVALARAVATWWAVRRLAPPQPRPWHLLVAGTVAWTLGEGYQVYAEIGGFYGASVNLADVCFLVGYACMAVGLVRIGRGREGRGPANGLVDATIVFVAVAVLAWAFLVTPTTVSHAGDGLPATLRMVYPLLDLGLICTLIWMGAGPQVRTTSYRLMIVSLMFWAGSNAGYHLDTFSSGSSAEILQDTWLAGHVLWGTAVLTPSLSGFWARRDRSNDEDTAGRLTMLLVAMMSAPLTLVLQLWLHRSLDVVAVAIAGSVMAALMSVRFRRLVRRMGDQTTRLKELSNTDFLTGLPNRRAATDFLETALADHDAGVGVIVIDLDRFKGFNDTFGHQVGDDLLVAVSRRWVERLGPDVLLARTGGDEFTAIVLPTAPVGGTLAAAWKVADALSDPVALGNLTLAVDVSVGLSEGGTSGPAADDLIHQADVAMYVAKTHQSRVETYRLDLDDGASERVVLLNDLRGAIDRSELVVHYQPQLNLRTGTVDGVEALVRWNHGERGMIAPGSFIPCAETTGLIRAITGLVLDQSLQACLQWREQGVDLRVGVNVSARCLFDTGFVDEVVAALDEHELPPSALDLEVTESSAMVDIDAAVRTLGRLAALGVRLSIDDFGTGYSSFDYIHRLPMRVLKIDQSFITAPGSALANELIVRSMVELATGLGMETVAEGVEDLTALDTLRSLGCDHAQGFGIARPMPENEIMSAVRSIELIHRRTGTQID